MPSTLDLNGKQLTIASNLSPPYVFMELENTTNQWNLTSGVEVKLLQALSKYFNFTHKVIHCKNDWGVRHNPGQPNEYWSGIIGALHSGGADIGLSGLTITDERSQYVYFTEPHIITSVSFITPPPKGKPKFSLVIEPFEPLVWICIISSMLLMLSFESLILRKCFEYRTSQIKWGFISALLKQPIFCPVPKITQLRLLHYFWLLACLVLTSSYGSCLYSLMAFPTKVKPINTLVELAAEQRSGRIQVTAIGNSSYFDGLKRSTFGVHKELGQYLKPIKDKEEGLTVVRNGSKPFAYISTRDHLIYGLLRYGSASIYLPPPTEESTVFVDLMGIAFQKNFSHREVFDKLISDLKIGGFLDYWRISENRQLVSNSEQTSTDDRYNRYHILHHVQLFSAYYLFVSGQITALILIFIEFVFNLRKLRLSHQGLHNDQEQDTFDNKLDDSK